MRRSDGEIVAAVIALGVAVIFGAGLWLIILTSIEAERQRKEREERRRR